MQPGSSHNESAKKLVGLQNRGRKHRLWAKRKISASLIGNKRAIGNQNARKVTPKMRAEIHRLLATKLGKRKIAKLVGVDKKTIINVAHGRH